MKDIAKHYMLSQAKVILVQAKSRLVNHQLPISARSTFLGQMHIILIITVSY